MPNFGTQCNGCSGEDCPACDIYQEARMDMISDRQDEQEAEMDFWDD